MSEAAIAAGIRRIEAVAGNAVARMGEKGSARQEEKFEALARKKAESRRCRHFRQTSRRAMAASIDARAAHLEKLEAEVRAWEKQEAKAEGAELQKRAAAIAKNCSKHMARNPSSSRRSMGPTATCFRRCSIR